MARSLAPHDSQRLVFVGGLHRSGTSPVARLLAQHPEISGFKKTGVPQNEGQHLQTVYPPAASFGGPGTFALDPRAHLDETSPLATAESARRLLDQWAPYWDVTRRLLVEKSPPNLIRTRFLAALFPAARFVMLVRHPVAVALATEKWVDEQTSLADLVGHWVRAHQIFADDAAYVSNLHVLKYEDLVADPVAALAALQGFLGLETGLSDDTIDESRSSGYQQRWSNLQRGWSIAGRWQVRRCRLAHAESIARFGYDIDDLDQVRPFFPNSRR